MKRSILIVDDNLDLLEMLEAVLGKTYEVSTANSGELGLAALTRDFSPDLVLLDVQMPDMSGLEFLDKMFEQGADRVAKSSVIFCSAGDPPADTRVVGSISKMVDLNDFIASIRKFADRCH